jgi:hypothetical protein
MPDQQGEPTPSAASVEANPTGLGSRAHVAQTLERARASVRTAHALTGRSHSLLARAATLVGASERIVQESVDLREQLRASVSAYARRLRAEGQPSERMLILVKTAVREAVPPELDSVELRELLEDVVRWSVEAYYDAA